MQTAVLSSQGQIVIPRRIRTLLGTKAGDKLKIRVRKNGKTPALIIEPPTKSWASRVKGVARGIYGNIDDYIEKERSSWDR